MAEKRWTKQELHESGIAYTICQVCLEPLNADMGADRKATGLRCEQHPWVYVPIPGPMPTREQRDAFFASIDQNPLTRYIPPRRPII